VPRTADEPQRNERLGGSAADPQADSYAEAFGPLTCDVEDEFSSVWALKLAE